MNDQYNLEKIAIFDIEIPETLEINVENPISFKYALVNGCHSFYDLEKMISNDGKTLTITAFAQVNQADVCTQVYTEKEINFSFKPTKQGTYKIRFWKKKNNQGEDEFTEIVIVIE
jgi:hypothetical protein